MTSSEIHKIVQVSSCGLVFLFSWCGKILVFLSLLFFFFLFFDDPPGDLWWVFWGKPIFLYLPFVIWVFGFSSFFWCLPLGFPFACVIY